MILPYFPTPYPDETVYSLIARYHVATASRSWKATLSQLLDTASAIPDAVLPNHLQALVERLPEPLTNSADPLITNHTLYPYFAKFQSAPKRGWLRRAMLGDDSANIPVRIGIVAGRLATPRRPRFCASCVQEDFDSAREPYWHRMHQLPGTYVCPMHATPLLWTGGEYPRQALLLPSFRDANSYGHSGARLYPQRLLCEIASLNVALLQDVRSQIDPHAARTAYRQALKAAGFISKGGRIREMTLLSAFNAHYASLLRWEHELSGFANFTSWVPAMVSGNRAIRNPLKHVLLIQYLFGDLAAFLKACRAPPDGAADAGRPVIAQPAIGALKQMLVVEKLSARQTAKQLGVSVETVLQHARRDGLRVGRRPKYNVRIQNGVLADATRTTMSTKQLAQRHGVSVTYVDRLLFAHADIKARRAALLRRHEVEARRNSVRRWLSRHGGASTKALRNARAANFMYLYRHDRQWLRQLTATLPRAKVTRHAIVDWHTRDCAFAHEVSQAIRELRELQPKKPVSVARVGRWLNRADWIDKHLGKLPSTARILQQLEARV